jgi:hypothetical protein
MVYDSRNTNFDTQTNVRINKDKKDLIKRKGYKLQEVLDIAMNVILNIEGLEEQEILQKIEEIDDAMRNLALERSMLIEQLDKEKQRQKDDVKNKYYDQLKTQYKSKWDFDETDDELLNKVALILNLDRIEVMNKIVEECREEAKLHSN